MADLIDVVDEVAIASSGCALTLIDTFSHNLRPYAGAEVILPRITVVVTYDSIGRGDRHRLGAASHTLRDVRNVRTHFDVKKESVAANACYGDNLAHGKIS
jgi:hypothetical protein